MAKLTAVNTNAAPDRKAAPLVPIASKSTDIIEIDPLHVRAGGLTGRLETDLVADDALIGSIRTYGQHTPILVRPYPSNGPNQLYQMICGRRRLDVLRLLRRPIKALVADIDDALLVVIQGQENSARLDPSFIEKVNFARQMRDSGAKRPEIMGALSIDKTLLSRMLLVADCVPVELIETIGRAPSIGRTRWQTLALTLDATDIGTVEACEIAEKAGEQGSDAAFEAVLAHAQPKSAKARPVLPANYAQPAPLIGADGTTLGRLRKTPKSVSLIFTTEASDGFENWLLEVLPELHKNWIAPNT